MLKFKSRKLQSPPLVPTKTPSLDKKTQVIIASRNIGIQTNKRPNMHSKFTMYIHILANPKMYIGIDKQLIGIIDLLCCRIKCTFNDVLLTLRKLDVMTLSLA